MSFSNRLYAFFHSYHSAEGKKRHLWGGQTRAYEYKYELKLCAFNVGEEKYTFPIWLGMIRKVLTMGSALKALIL